MADLPPVPASPVPPSQGSPRTIIQPIAKATPPQGVGPSTVFDQAPPAVVVARQRASGLRTALAAALRQLLTAKQSAEVTLAEAKDDAALNDALTSEGIPVAKLAALLKAAKPLLDQFTTTPPPPPAPQASGQAPPPSAS
jgi:hypothetical protein